MSRINYIDGHRGIAILLVVMFHAFSRWSDLMPFGDEFSEFPLFKFGYLGVQLFFLISGFVILMTLERCDNIKTFLYRRWLRLFPAMLICSIFIFFTTNFFPERPNGQPALKDLIAGLSFVEPYIWQKVMGLQLHSLEGSFWSLYVEFKFYIIAAFLYFYIGSQRLVLALFLCFMCWFLLDIFSQMDIVKSLSFLRSATVLLSFEYFGWFSAGSAYYLFVKTKSKKWLFIGMFISLISSVAESKLNIGPLVATILISLFFVASIVSIRLQRVISSRFFMYMGFVSYPLYLLHENMMVAITIKLNNYIHIVPSYLFPVVAIAFITTLAYFIANSVEPFVRKKIDNLTS
jgi:peptidoglycan/LPS O-acetylase OafA/YrhL